MSITTEFFKQTVNRLFAKIGVTKEYSYKKGQVEFLKPSQVLVFYECKPCKS